MKGEVVDEGEVSPVKARREGSSGYAYLRLLFDPETVGSANAVLATVTIPPGQPEPMLPTPTSNMTNQSTSCLARAIYS